MCNAWNHEPGCSCGFGGAYYGNTVSMADAGGLASYESYVNPFARCPVCRAPVFFYQATNGGRVFFDELGPPWPKHPCTDRTVTRCDIPIDRSLRRPPDAASPAWQREGWFPFFLTDAYLPRGQRQYRVSGRFLTGRESSSVTILMHGDFAGRVSEWVNLWNPTAPTFYRCVKQECEVSGITTGGGRITEHLLKGLVWF